MSEEEKKAIERLKGILDYKKEIDKKFKDNTIQLEIEYNVYIEEMPFKEIEIIVNGYVKQQDIINKAIEYIEEKEKYDGEECFDCYSDEIIGILKGE